LSAPSYSKGAIFAGALKNILLAALVNQFSPTSCSQRFCIAAAKIVSPPRGTIMLCNIIYTEAPPACSLQETGLCGKYSAFFAGNSGLRKAQRALCRKQRFAQSPACFLQEAELCAKPSVLFTGNRVVR
jgi:hypothetical protein